MRGRRGPNRSRGKDAPPYVHSLQTNSAGLPVHVLRMDHLHTASLGLFVRVGSRHEAPELNGVSHFLEHVFFRGCEAYPSSRLLNGALEDLGGSLDGFTARDYTGYQTSVVPEAVEEALEVLGQMIRRPRMKGLDVERRVVREEMLEALDERGRRIELDALAHAQHFPGHSLGQPIEGTRRNLPRFDVDALNEHRRRFYGARNAVLVVAGPVHPARIQRRAEASFDIPAGRKRGDGPRPPSPSHAFRFVRHRGPQTRIRFSFRAFPERHRDFAALVWLRRWFDGGLSARLQVELVDRLGLAYEVAAGIDSYSDAGVFDFELTVANEKLPLAVRELGHLIDDVRRRHFGSEEVEAIKRRARSSFGGMLDAPQDLAHWYGVGALFGALEGPEERLARVLALDGEDIRRTAKKVFRRERLSVTAVGGAAPGDVARARRAVSNFDLP
ncbi:MAG: pitrilysin family protein [Myxococcota bacterium]